MVKTTKKNNKKTDVEEVLEIEREERRMGIQRRAGHYSESVITRRNRGVRHQFASDIGGCSSNYR